MPTLHRKKKVLVKKKKVAVKARKKPAKVLRRKAVKRVVKKTVKKVVRRRPAVTPVRKQPKRGSVARPLAVPAMYGKVTHYYDRIGVAIIELQMPLALGDFVRIRHGEAEFIQPVTSLQIEHMPIARANVGDIVGLRVMQKAPEGSAVLPM